MNGTTEVSKNSPYSAAHQRNAAHWRVTGYILAVFFLLLYILLYSLEPLPQPWNDKFIYAAILLAAWVGAITCTLAWRCYVPGDLPRKVWGWFTLGVWSWAIGELVWLVVNPYLKFSEDILVSDLFFSAAYFMFAAAIFYQYTLLHAPTHHERRTALALLAISLLLIPLTITLLLTKMGIGSEYSLPGLYLYVFYPLGDLILGAAGIYFSGIFGRGLIGRAWWGLVAFAISDFISTWYTLGGSALLSTQADFWLSLFTDVLYFGAYLLMALAGWSQYLLLKYGPSLPEPAIESRNEAYSNVK
jgi:hypothetical protein